MPIATVRLDDDQAAWVESQTTRYRKKADVIRDLIDTARQGLTAGVDCAPTTSVRKNVEVSQPAVQAVLPSEPAVGEVAVPAVPVVGDPLEKKITTRVSKREIPPSLFSHTELIREFWRIKGGSKSDTAWKLLMTELGKIQDSANDRVLREQIELAINGKFKSITLRNFERFGRPDEDAAARKRKEFTGSAFDWSSINGMSI